MFNLQNSYGSAFGQGMAMGRQVADMNRQRELQEMYRQYGAGIAAGDPGAINALARHDPMAAFGINRQIVADRRASEAHGQSTQLNAARLQQIETSAKREAEIHAARMSAVEREREAQELGIVVAKGAAALRAGGPAFEAWKQEYAEDLAQIAPDISAITPENAVAILAAGKGIASALAGRDFALPDARQSYRQITGKDAQALGLDPSKAYNVGPDGKVTSIGGGGVSVNIGSEVGNIPQGYELFTNPETGGRSMRPIEGGPEDKSAQAEARSQAQATTADVVTAAATRALEANKSRVLGGVAGRLASFNPGSQNAEVYRQVEVLRGNATIESLNAMKQQSPTGGALGDVTEREGAMLAARAGALDPASPNFERDLMDYTQTLLRVVHGKNAGDQVFSQLFSSQTSPAQNNNPYSGMSIDEKLQIDISTLTPEQKQQLLDSLNE